MSLATFTTTDNTEVRIGSTAVVALEALSVGATKIFVSNGRTFVVRDAIGDVVTAFGL